MAAPLESDAFFLTMPPRFRKLDQGFARRLELQLLRFQLGACCNFTHTLPRALTFDMRGAQKAQPFGHPLDGWVRQLPTRRPWVNSENEPQFGTSWTEALH